MLSVELGLYLLARVLPGRPARDAWTLFGGYPYAEAAGHARTDEQRLAIRRARHYLWTMRRRRVWLSHLERYAPCPEELRGYLLDGPDDVPVPRSPARAAARFEKFEELLTSPPEFARRDIPLAKAGQYLFPVRDRSHLGHLHAGARRRPQAAGARPGRRRRGPGRAGRRDLGPAPGGRARDGRRRGAGRPPGTAAATGRTGWPASSCSSGSRTASRRERPLQVNGLLHLVGMVGAGKSTLRDILTYWYVTQDTSPIGGSPSWSATWRRPSR